METPYTEVTLVLRGMQETLDTGDPSTIDGTGYVGTSVTG